MRKVPPTIVIALALLAAEKLLHVGAVLTSDGDLRSMLWFYDLSAGLTFTIMPLFIAGMLALRQRTAAIAFAVVTALIALRMGLMTDPERFMKHSVVDALSYANVAAQLVAYGSLAHAVWARRPGLAICAIAAAIMASPPPYLWDAIYGVFGTTYRSAMLVPVALQVPRLAIMALLSIELGRDAEDRPIMTADGLRHAARALCVCSALAAVVSIPAIHLPFLLTAFAGASLGWVAFGLLRAASSRAHRWHLSAAATAILWCASLQLTMLPQSYLRHALSAPHAISFLALVAAAVFVTLAARSVVDKMHVQAKGFGAVIMFVTALAIQLFLVPQSQTERSMIALEVLTGFAVALGAWMLSWLCKLTAQRFESSDSPLPAARVV
jgi:hypothetical protein